MNSASGTKIQVQIMSFFARWLVPIFVPISCMQAYVCFSRHDYVDKTCQLFAIKGLYDYVNKTCQMFVIKGLYDYVNKTC
jgi:hypothetical protein